MHKKVEKIVNLKIPKEIRLFILLEEQAYWFYNGKALVSNKGLRWFKNIKIERGEVLDAFSRLEFIVNEIIRIKIIEENFSKIEYIWDLLNRVELSGKTHLLRKWKIIDRKTEEKLIKLKKIRDNFAHSLAIEEIKYKDKSLFDNKKQFREDLYEIITILNNKYVELLKKTDIDYLKSIFENY